MLCNVTDVYIDGIYIKKYNTKFDADVALLNAEKLYGISLHTDLFFKPTKKYANIENAVNKIANEPNAATFDNAVNLFNKVNGKSITKLIIILITNL